MTCAHARLEALAERDHAPERLLGQDLGERRAHRREREHVGGERAADAADVGELLLDRVVRLLRHRLREPVGGGRHAGGERLADREDVGLEPVRRRVAARPRADRVRLVDDQQRARAARRLAQRVVVAGLRQHDADVGQRGLGQHARDVAVGELALERLDVVELDHARRVRRRHGRADGALARDDAAVVRQRGERLVDGAVVAPVEHEDLRPARHRASDPEGEAVGVRRGQRELPVGQPEAPRHLLADPQRVLARQHQRDAARGLRRDRAQRRLGRVAGHRAGVAEAEVDVLVAVDVGEARALGLGREHGEAAGPAHHPVHRHAAEQRVLRLLGERVGARVLGAEALELAGHQLIKRHRSAILPDSRPCLRPS